jgi:methyl-accepting chemotaxis protein
MERMILDQLPVSRKLAVLVTVSLCGIIATASIGLMQIHSAMLEDRQDKVQAVVDTAYTQITAQPDDEAAKDLARAARYGDGDYLFILDTQGRIVTHPITPELEGRSLMDMKDTNGVPMFKNMIEVATTQGEGFVAYSWPKTANGAPLPKISYVHAIPDRGWILGSGIYVDDVTEAFKHQALLFGGVTIALLLGLAVLSTLVARNLTRPLGAMTKTMERLAEGDLEVEVDGTNRKDEIGHMAEAVVVFREHMREAKRLSDAQKLEQEAKEKRREEMDRKVRAFEMTVVRVLDGLAAADQGMKAMASDMTRGARETLEEAQEVTQSAERASSNVQTVASAAEELSASILEIGRRVEESSDVAKRAVTDSERASGGINELEQRVGQITEIVGLISDIADQTNLLALNATIEAARAGDAGKGFAVVASEVKALANQTQKATEDIIRRIGDVESATKVSVSAITEVTKVIGEVHHIAASISAAVEEQGAATQEIARNVDEAARGTESVTTAIVKVRASAEDADQRASDMQAASVELGRQADSLKSEVAAFLRGMQDEGEQHSEIVTWNESLSFGNKAIDEDHRRLMDLVNAVYRKVKEGVSSEQLTGPAEDLRRYAQTHFKEEEAFMARIDYPGLAAHTRQHTQFLERLRDLGDIRAKEGDSAAMHLMGLLGNWWESHIREQDAKVAEFVRQKKRAA